jgi:N-acetylglutamate synthase-like GNAT family acetyltransferase
VSHFAVVEKLRGQGIGSQLMTYLEDVVRNMGGKEMWVYSERARRFYEKQGFEFVTKGYIEDCWQDFLMKVLD